MNATPRSYNYFRLGESMERVGVSENTLRLWNKAKGGPAIIKMNNERLVFMRFSEVEDYIERNSTETKTI